MLKGKSTSLTGLLLSLCQSAFLSTILCSLSLPLSHFYPFIPFSFLFFFSHSRDSEFSAWSWEAFDNRVTLVYQMKVSLSLSLSLPSSLSFPSLSLSLSISISISIYLIHTWQTRNILVAIGNDKDDMDDTSIKIYNMDKKDGEEPMILRTLKIQKSDKIDRVLSPSLPLPRSLVSLFFFSLLSSSYLTPHPHQRPQFSPSDRPALLIVTSACPCDVYGRA
jgi:hypothetical protein